MSKKIPSTRAGTSQQSGKTRPPCPPRPAPCTSPDLQLLRLHPIVILASTAGGSLLLGFLIGLLVSRFCR